jgi:predicted AAA+ superfamily ATPase
MVNFNKFNRHWDEGYFYPFDKKRFFFSTLKRFADKRQIIALTGLRRTGKTTLLKQLINDLISRGVLRKNILYFSFDESVESLDSMLNEYSMLTKVDYKKEQVFVFLDEVQKLKDWQNQVKTYYDNFEKIKFFVSGSATLFIQKKAHESLAGRVFILELQILSFEEYLFFKEKSNLLKDSELFAGELKQEFFSYLKRNLIEIIDYDDDTANEYLQGLINKIAFEDIPSLFSIENPEKLKSILKAVYSSPGMVVNYENLGKDLGLSAKTTETYVFYLTQAKILKKLYNFSKNFLTSEKKSKKLYISAPSMCFLGDNPELPKIVENLVAVQSEIHFFWRTPQKDEIDFILKKNGSFEPIEVKYSENIVQQDTRAIKKFAKRNTVTEAVIITKNASKTEQLPQTKIKYIPAFKWALEQKQQSQ